MFSLISKMVTGSALGSVLPPDIMPPTVTHTFAVREPVTERW